MKHNLLTIPLVLVVAAAACTKNSESPSSTTTTTIATTTSTAATTTTTTTAQTTFTLSGQVTDAKTKDIVKFADIEVISGVNAGRRFQGDGNGNYTAVLTAGSFVMRAWALGYETNDVSVTLVNANLRVDVTLTPVPLTTTTTTTVAALSANFTYSPNPCTITGLGAVVDCTVDASPSTGNIGNYEWKYKGKTVSGSASKISLALACSDLGSQKDDTVFVTLTVADITIIATATTTKGVVIVKNGACGF